MKVHHFNVEEAEKHGVEKAVILYNLRFWLEKNKANGTNEHDGYYWTYNSAQAFSKLFPYFSKHKVNRLLKQLETDGFVLTGCYNKKGYDRTKWYSLPEFSVETSSKTDDKPFCKNAKCNLQNCEMDIAELQDGFCRSATPIPDSKPNDKPDSKPDIAFDDFWNAYDKKVDRAKCLAKWEKLTTQEHQAIMANVDAYVAANNDKQYRKNPLTYLNGKCWEDEIITRQPTNQKNNSNVPHWQQTYVPPAFSNDDIQPPTELSEEEQQRVSEQFKKAKAELFL